MTLRCIFCTRPLKRAAYLLGGQPVGPDCARKHNLTGTTAAPNKRIERVPRPPPRSKSDRDPHTVDMFSELTAAEPGLDRPAEA